MGRHLSALAPSPDSETRRAKGEEAKEEEMVSKEEIKEGTEAGVEEEEGEEGEEGGKQEEGDNVPSPAVLTPSTKG